MALNKPYRIDRVVYPRPEPSQSDWLGFVNPSAPAFDAALWPAIEQLLRSFLVAQRDLSPRLNEHQVGLVPPAAPGFDAALWPAVEQLLRAFRVAERELKPRLNEHYLGRPPASQEAEPKAASGILGGDFTVTVQYQRTDFPQFGWIFQSQPVPFDASLFPGIDQLVKSFKVDRPVLPPLGEHWVNLVTPGTVPFDATLFPGIDQLVKSYRVHRPVIEPRGNHWFDRVPDAAPVFDPALIPAFEQLRHSQRMGDRNLRRDIEQPFVPFQAPAVEPTIFFPGIDQLVKSFRVAGPIPDVFKFVIRVDEFNPPVPPEPPPSVCPPLTTAADGNASPDPPSRSLIRLWPTQQPEVFETLPTDVGGADNGMTTIGVTFDGAGSVLTVGKTADIWIPFGATITGNTMLADQVGSVQIGVWKDTYANYPPTGADSITGGTPPTITSANKSQDLTLTGWTTAITAGDTIRFNVNSVTTITQVTLTLRVQKT